MSLNISNERFHFYLLFLFLFEEITGTTNQYCLNELFNPTCSNSEVVKVDSARFGRMNVGKCIKENELRTFENLINDPKYFGCSEDVSFLLTQECGLKIFCSVKILDLNEKINNTCAPGLIQYLEASYSCLKIVSELNNNCHIPITDEITHISPKNSRFARCGSDGSPFILETKKGRNLKLTHLQFHNDDINDGRNRNAIHHTSYCANTFGTIIDNQSRKNYTICRKSFELNGNKETIMISNSNKLSFILKEYVITNKDLFVLKIEAIGCSDMIPPDDAWLKRTNNEMTVSCYSSKKTWHLKCQNNNWTGVLGNCTSSDYVILKNPENMEIIYQNKNNNLNITMNQQVLIIVSISAFGLVICLIIIFTGAICLKKMNSEESKCIHQSYYNNASNNLLLNENINQKFNSTNEKKNLQDVLNDNNDATINIIPNMDNNYFILDKD